MTVDVDGNGLRMCHLSGLILPMLTSRKVAGSVPDGVIGLFH